MKKSSNNNPISKRRVDGVVQSHGSKRSKPSVTLNQEITNYPMLQDIDFPHMEVTEDDFRRFEAESIKKYGVAKELSDTEKQINREKSRLLGELRLPLNNCGSKYLVIGLDPFNNFEARVRIVKQGFESGITFTTKTFTAFVDKLHEVTTSLDEGIPTHIELENCALHCLQNKVLQFIPKFEGDVQVYLALPTVHHLHRLQNLVFTKMTALERNKCSNFVQFCEDMVDEVANRVDLSVSDNLIFSMAHLKYKEDLLLRELVCKFPTFVLQEIYYALDNDNRINQYVLQFTNL